MTTIEKRAEEYAAKEIAAIKEDGLNDVSMDLDDFADTIKDSFLAGARWRDENISQKLDESLKDTYSVAEINQLLQPK